MHSLSSLATHTEFLHEINKEGMLFQYIWQCTARKSKYAGVKGVDDGLYRFRTILFSADLDRSSIDGLLTDQSRSPYSALCVRVKASFLSPLPIVGLPSILHHPTVCDFGQGVRGGKMFAPSFLGEERTKEIFFSGMRKRIFLMKVSSFALTPALFAR